MTRHVFHELSRAGGPRGQTQLALQEKRRGAPFIRGHEVSRPEPIGQRGFGIMQNRPRREGDLIPTAGALPAPRFHDFISTLVLSPWVHEAVWPAAFRQALLASRFGSEHGLELVQGFRKHGARQAYILQVVAC